ncbi:MAG: endo alpha-1,4 polygalactosaminidase [Aquificaceae bacterium]|nr:endo alpha-1,4 polygalactosaminidase [Aquificaceae bacterium]
MIFIITLLCIFSLTVIRAEELSVGFMIYGEPIPEEALYAFDWLVLEPESPHTKRVMKTFYLSNRKAKLIAYISVGEIGEYRDYFRKVKSEWLLGKNKVWNSFVTDLRAEGYVNFLLYEVFPRLEDFDGFFLDTLDSHQLFLKEEKDLKQVRENLIKLVKTLKQRYPEKIILLNRGFEVMEALRGYADAIVAESLFYGISYDEKKSYKLMKKEESNWLLERLKRAKELGYKVVVIDYVDPKDRTLQREAVRNIRKLGFIPYVSDRYLRTLGASHSKLKPRRVLLLYSGELYKDPSFSILNRLIQPWIEYLGYVPVLMEAEKALSDNRLNYFMGDIYAGIVADFGGIREQEKLYRWLIEKKEEGLKVFFLNAFSSSRDERHLKSLGIKMLGQLRAGQSYTLEKSSFKELEAKPLLMNVPMLVPDRAKAYLKLRAGNTLFYPLAVTEWGGYAQPGALLVQRGELTLFTLDPVELFSMVFEPYELIPDVTTESGRRMLLVHIDGDAFFGDADFDPSRNIGEVIRDEIIKKYPVPHTVSIIEGEVAPYGLYPERSERLERVARSIFALKNVEVASHTFSHPYKWQEIEAIAKNEAEAKLSSPIAYNLPLKDYKFDPRREIQGSIEYINRRLAPEGKRVRVFLWSGDASPSEQTLKLAYEAGVYNVNGGYTWINRKHPYRMFISPMGVNRGEFFQIYAPMLNENIYTNLWTDFYGFVRVIDTFGMTENPYRIKPINIYYHMYSGQKLASLEALRKVYNWAMSQEIIPLFLSEYAQKVLEYRNMALMKHIETGELVVRGGGSLRTLRVDKKVHVDLLKSKGVVGYRHHKTSTYISLDPSGDYRVVFSEIPSPFRVVSSNGKVVNFSKGRNGYALHLSAHVPLEVELEVSECTLKVEPKPDTREVSGKITRIKYGSVRDARLEINCKE